MIVHVIIFINVIKSEFSTVFTHNQSMQPPEEVPLMPVEQAALDTMEWIWDTMTGGSSGPDLEAQLHQLQILSKPFLIENLVDKDASESKYCWIEVS